jgi:hypothetical protein
MKNSGDNLGVSMVLEHGTRLKGSVTVHTQLNQQVRYSFSATSRETNMHPPTSSLFALKALHYPLLRTKKPTSAGRFFVFIRINKYTYISSSHNFVPGFDWISTTKRI